MISSTSDTLSNINTSISSLLTSGIALVGMPLGTKGPITSGWNLPQNVIRDPRQSVRLQGLNVGIAHAYCIPSPTCAIDIDNFKTAKPWLSMHGIDLFSLLYASNAVVIWSGKKYSIKLLYRLPLSCTALESKKIVGDDGKSALEFRCASKDGKTVQDVIPPSIHPNGQTYIWMGQGNPLNPPVIPVNLLSVWQQLISNTARVAQRPITGIIAQNPRQETPRQIAIIKAALTHISADCSYEMWRSIIWSILSTGWTCAEDISIEWSKTAPERFDDDSFWLVANSYIPNHSSAISLGTVYHHARIGGWNE